MSELAATEVYDTMYHSYAESENPHRTIYHALPILDFQLRFVAILATGYVRHSGISGAKLNRSLGFGTLIATLKGISKDIDEGTQNLSRIQSLVDQVIGVIGTPVKLPDSGKPRTITSIRNLASHSSPIPDDIDINREVDAVSDLIVNFLSSCRVEYSGGECSIIDDQENSVIDIYPLIHSTSAGTWNLYSRAKQSSYTFSVHGGSSFDTSIGEKSKPEIVKFIREHDLSRNDELQISAFHSDAINDLSTFAEADTKPTFLDQQSEFTVFWTRAFGTGSQNRADTFRLAADFQRLWRDDSGSWTPYSRLLTEITGWSNVAKRLSHFYRRELDSIIAQEAEMLGFRLASDRSLVYPEVRVTDLDGSRPRRTDFSDVIKKMLEDLGGLSGQTHILFINADAGAGKTRCMLQAAIDQSDKVAESNDGYSLPLLLYVRAHGNAMSNINDAIDAAVATTRALTQQSVGTLSRNGLLAIMIDGFDEFVGDSSYSDAIGSLKGWLAALGGRGAMVISARSSYYLNQYRSSVNRAVGPDAPAVRHRIATLLPWTEAKVIEYAATFGLEGHLVRSLPKGERHALRLPFFAHAFVELHLSDEASSNGTSALSYLVSSYIKRESGKLTDSIGDGALMTAVEIEQLFEHAAETMSENSERIITLPELEYLAEMAIGEELRARKGLRERLSTMCTIAAQSGQRHQFGFTHEVFYDFFLAGSIIRYLAGSDSRTADVQRLLRASPWRDGTVDRIISDETSRSHLIEIADRRYGGMVSELGSNQSVNIGSIISAVIERGESVDGQWEISGATVSDELNLSGFSGKLLLGNCQLESLKLPGKKGWGVDLSGTSIRQLTVNGQNLAGATNISSNLVENVVCSGEFIYRPSEIAAVLVDRGAEVVDRKIEVTTPNAELDTYKAILRVLISRGATTVIIKADDWSLIDARLDSDIPNHKEWREFARRLMRNELAKRESFASSGRAKYRLRLTVSAEDILAQKDDPRISQFWVE
ncbi:NACHT domain-containing protein [Gordonia polyisoprenivorans]|uniref:NACHT domain-containing protein n=1 Tax=Gordonia polyisoprenivorans TaxID=84595 RepID=UPI001AD7BDF5|nr:hypothetical protein [Gordonia polyisoprenivorans]QTI69615.1 hypothetical protein J6U32_03105 [Gordonia polyisoprenivorans]